MQISCLSISWEALWSSPDFQIIAAAHIKKIGGNLGIRYEVSRKRSQFHPENVAETS